MLSDYLPKRTFWRICFFKKEVEISNEEQKPLMWKHSHFCNDEWSGEEGHDLFHFCFCSSWDCQVGFAAWLLYSGAPFSVFYSNLWGKKEYFFLSLAFLPSYSKEKHFFSNRPVTFLAWCPSPWSDWWTESSFIRNSFTSVWREELLTDLSAA